MDKPCDLIDDDDVGLPPVRIAPSSQLFLVVLIGCGLIVNILMLWYLIFLTARTPPNLRVYVVGAILIFWLSPLGYAACGFATPATTVVFLCAIILTALCYFIDKRGRADCFRLKTGRLSRFLKNNILQAIPGSTGAFWTDANHALTHAREGGTDTALRLMNKWRRNRQKSVDAFLLMTFRINDDLEGTARLLDYLVARQSERRWCPDDQLVNLALIYIERGQWRKAIYLLDCAKPRKTPSLAPIYAFLGCADLTYSKEKRVKNGKVIVHKFAQELYNQAVSLQAHGDMEQARSRLTGLLTIIENSRIDNQANSGKRRRSNYETDAVSVNIIEKRARRRLAKMIEEPSLVGMWPCPDADPEWILKQLSEVSRHWAPYRAPMNVIPPKVPIAGQLPRPT